MQIGSRFTEYGLTGGFFWICQILFLTYTGQTKILLSNLSNLSTLQRPLDWILPISSTAISALAIIAVFVAGLLLDLLAVYFRPWEMQVFHQHLVRNRDWLGRLIVDHKAYCETDYEEFERKFGGSPVAKDRRARFGISLLWNRERRQLYAAARKQRREARKAWKGARPYERLWSFFASYVLVESGSSQLSLMVDQYYLWRTGRAVSMSLVIVFFEVQYLADWLAVIRANTSSPPVQFPPPGQHWYSAMPRTFFLLALITLAIMITKKIYSRLCFTLFALVYVTQDKRNVELQKTA
ncbi:MAG TPA: hypothetical protein VGA01_14135 [Candidatus Binatia bacterium]